MDAVRTAQRAGRNATVAGDYNGTWKSRGRVESAPEIQNNHTDRLPVKDGLRISMRMNLAKVNKLL